MGSIIHQARAVVVALTENSLKCVQQLQAITIGMMITTEADEKKLAPLPVIPLATPRFGFPTDSYWRETFPSLWYGDASDVDLVKQFFKRIAVPFAYDAADNVIQTHANLVLSRIPRVVKGNRDGIDGHMQWKAGTSKLNMTALPSQPQKPVADDDEQRSL